MKASPMDSLFQLGVTRYALPESSSSGSSNGSSHSPTSNNSSNGSSSPAGGAASGGRLTFNGNGSLVGLGEGLIKDEDETASCKKGAEEDDYHLTATPGAASVVYSEGTQKTDLLY
ncbi:hypothetical protein KR059_004687 [Drosophila kikkawai]|nr:hypothetical protein KR059_004687 [Drosophila kikkawai]